MSMKTLKDSLYQAFKSRIEMFRKNAKDALGPLMEELDSLRATFGDEAVETHLADFGPLFGFGPKAEKKRRSSKKARADEKPAAKPAPAAKKSAKRRKAGKKKPSPGRQVHGRYVGLLIKVPSGRREHFKQIARDSGKEAAIKAIQEELKS